MKFFFISRIRQSSIVVIFEAHRHYHLLTLLVRRARLRFLLAVIRRPLVSFFFLSWLRSWKKIEVSCRRLLPERGKFCILACTLTVRSREIDRAIYLFVVKHIRKATNINPGPLKAREVQNQRKQREEEKLRPHAALAVDVRISVD